MHVICHAKPSQGSQCTCRCNFDEHQRAPWVRIATQGSHRGGVYVMGFHLNVPARECIGRAENRVDHPTLNGKDVVDVILK